jgi:hypothetical protein
MEEIAHWEEIQLPQSLAGGALRKGGPGLPGREWRGNGCPCGLVPLRGERGGDVGVDGEVAMQAGRAQELRDREAGGGQEYGAAEQFGTALRADQDGQPGRIAGRNMRQVDYQRACAAMKHVDQVFPQLSGGGEVEGTAQPDDTATGMGGSRAAEGGADAGHDDRRPARARRVWCGMPFSLASGQASGLATRKNTAHVNTIQFRDTVYTLK